MSITRGTLLHASINGITSLLLCSSLWGYNLKDQIPQDLSDLPYENPLHPQITREIRWNKVPYRDIKTYLRGDHYSRRLFCQLNHGTLQKLQKR